MVLLAVVVDGAIVLLFLALILLVKRSFRRQRKELEQLAFCDPVTGDAAAPTSPGRR